MAVTKKKKEKVAGTLKIQVYKSGIQKKYRSKFNGIYILLK